MSFTIAIDNRGDSWFVPLEGLMFLSVLDKKISVISPGHKIVSLSDLDRREDNIIVTEQEGKRLKDHVSIHEDILAVRDIAQACKTTQYDEPGVKQLSSAYLGSFTHPESLLSVNETLAVLYVAGDLKKKS